MKKIILGMVIVGLMAPAANAGLLDALGITKKAEPQTLAEACDTNEIKKICPEVLIGSKSMTECLKENVKSLSKQCADFVKKSVAQKVETAKAKVSGDAAAASATTATAKENASTAAAEKIDTAKQAASAAQQFGNSLKSLF